MRCLHCQPMICYPPLLQLTHCQPCLQQISCLPYFHLIHWFPFPPPEPIHCFPCQQQIHCLSSAPKLICCCLPYNLHHCPLSFRSLLPVLYRHNTHSQNLPLSQLHHPMTGCC